MQKSPRLFRLAAVGLAVSLALAAGSFGLQQHGPAMGEIGSGCGPASDQPCYVPLLSAGWPVAYMIDAPDKPAPGRLGLEDQIRPEIFLVDALFYFSLLSLAWRYGQIRRRIRTERDGARGRRD